MNEIQRTIKVGFYSLFFYLALSCSEENRSTKYPSHFEYDNYDKFIGWTISYRERDILLFDKIDGGIVEKRYQVKNENGIKVLIAFVDDKSYKSYENLTLENKKNLPEDLILDFLNLGLESLIYKEEGKNRFLIIDIEQNTFIKFFEYDSVNPPIAIRNYKNLKNWWYFKGR